MPFSHLFSYSRPFWDNLFVLVAEWPADEGGNLFKRSVLVLAFALLMGGATYALTAATIITLKVTDKANSIPTDPPSVTSIPGNGNGGTLGP